MLLPFSYSDLLDRPWIQSVEKFGRFKTQNFQSIIGNIIDPAESNESCIWNRK